MLLHCLVSEGAQQKIACQNFFLEHLYYLFVLRHKSICQTIINVIVKMIISLPSAMNNFIIISRSRKEQSLFYELLCIGWLLEKQEKTKEGETHLNYLMIATSFSLSSLLRIPCSKRIEYTATIRGLVHVVSTKSWTGCVHVLQHLSRC